MKNIEHNYFSIADVEYVLLGLLPLFLALLQFRPACLEFTAQHPHLLILAPVHVVEFPNIAEIHELRLLCSTAARQAGTYLLRLARS